MKSSRADSYLPKSILALREYSLPKFIADLIAGLTVGLVALPLAMAFAISSGVLPQAGIYTAVIAGFLISALGGSMTQIGGPTGAFVVVVAGIVSKHGIDGLFMCTLMAGVLLMVLGLTGLGTAVKYIPRPVVIGFTNGIAVLIASTQIKDFFGLQIAKVPGEFLGRMEAILAHWGTLSTTATAVSCLSLGVLIVFMKWIKRVPGSIVVLLLGTAIAWGLHLPLETIETRFGGIPAGLPQFAMPSFRFDLILPLLSPALTVTMLGAIESLLSAVVADRMSGDKHKPNVELFAQGVANVMSPLFGGLPATGAIARTATNIRSGAQTPVAGMIHALVLLLILLVAAPLAKHIPLTVLADLTVAVEVGMVMAALLYIVKVTGSTTVTRVTPEYVEAGFSHSLQVNPLPEGVAAYRIHGPFLFGATDKLSLVEEEFAALPPVVILRLRNMTAIDATGLHALENLAERLVNSGRHLILCGMRDQPAKLMTQADFHQHIGGANICISLKAAVERAREILEAVIHKTGPPEP